MAPRKRGREWRHRRSDRPDDNRNPDSRAGRAGRDFRGKDREQGGPDSQPRTERRTRTRKVNPKRGPLGVVPSEIEVLPSLLAEEGENRPPVRPIKVKEVEERPVKPEQNDRKKREKKKGGTDEPHEREETGESDPRPATRAHRAKGDSGRVGIERKTPSATTSGAKVGRPREERRPLGLDEAMNDPYVRGLYEKQFGNADGLSKEGLRERFQTLVEKTAGQTRDSGPGQGPESSREDKRRAERVEHAKASDAIRKVMEHYVPKEGGARASFEKYQYDTMQQLGDLSETVYRHDTGRALKVSSRTEELVKRLKAGEDPVTALRQFQMDRIVDKQKAMMDVGRLVGKSLGRLTDTSFNHQDGHTGASSAVMEAYRKVEKDIVASSPLKTGQPKTTDFSKIASRETFQLRLAENHAESRNAARMAKEIEQGNLKRLGIVSSTGLGCGFVYQREEGSIHSSESWHKAFVLSNANTAAVSSCEFSRPAVVSYEKRGEGGDTRMYLGGVGVLGDRAWEDLRKGKTYEDLYAEVKGKSAAEVAERLIPFSRGGEGNRFSVYGKSGPLEPNMRALYHMTAGTEDMMVRDLNRFMVSPEELRKSGVMRTFTAEELGHDGKYISQVDARTGNFLTDFTAGSWTIASMLGQNPQLIADRRLTGLKDRDGVEHDVEKIREQLERLGSMPEAREQKRAELFKDARSVSFETAQPVTVKDPIAGLVIDKAMENLAGSLAGIYKDSRAIGEKLAEGKAAELERAAFNALSSMRTSPRKVGVAKAVESTSVATVEMADVLFRAELRESKREGTSQHNLVGNFAWAKVETYRAVTNPAGEAMNRIFDGPLALKEGAGNPEVLMYLPSAYSRRDGVSGELYECLEHIRHAPRGSSQRFQVGASSMRVEGQNGLDYRRVFTRLVREEMAMSGAVTEEARAEWLNRHIDAVRAVGIIGSLEVASKIATITQGRTEVFTDFGASLNVDSAMIKGSPENLSGRLQSAGVMAGEARMTAERAMSAKVGMTGVDSENGTTHSFEVIEGKKQSSPREDGFTGQDGEFVLKHSEGNREPEPSVEIWTRSGGVRRRGLASEGTTLPSDDGRTVRMGIGHSFHNLVEMNAELKRGRPLEDILDTIKGSGVRVVFLPSRRVEPSESTGDADRNTTSSPNSP